MTAQLDGTIVCDNCGADVSGGITVAAPVFVFDSNHQPTMLHLGLACCTVLADVVAAMTWRQTDPASPGPVTLYTPEPVSNNHPDTVSIHQKASER